MREKGVRVNSIVAYVFILNLYIRRSPNTLNSATVTGDHVAKDASSSDVDISQSFHEQLEGITSNWGLKVLKD